MSSDNEAQPLILLIAPNVSEQMGGEGIKALQIFREMRKVAPETVQITHERNRAELTDRLKLDNVLFVEDTPVSKFYWKSIVFRWLVNSWFSKKAVQMAEAYADQQQAENRKVVIHQTEPNSPVSPRAVSKLYLNVFGPINGNIYYPKAFRKHEKVPARVRRVAHFPLQWVNRLFRTGIAKADLIFTAGGARTRDSLLAAGCRPEILFESLDCGIPDPILDRPRVTHSGVNLRFVHYGRLVFHKGTALIIECLKKTTSPVTLDIIGAGPELESCKALVARLGLADRVNFLPWFKSHSDLLDSLGQYRGMVFPSIEDANGIVVQEAMAMGLPVVSLDWGGPQLLIDHGKTGYLVFPDNREQITTELAQHLHCLAQDGKMAESFSIAGRNKAGTWRWSVVAKQWVSSYPKVTLAT